MSGSKYQAPRQDFGLFASPPLSQWHQLALANQVLLNKPNVRLGGRLLTELRSQARRDFTETARRWNPSIQISPNALQPGAVWLMTGHQPELYHPGVWAKNFAVSLVAKNSGMIGLNLVADTDQFKTNQIRVPAGSLQQPEIVNVAFDSVDDGRPDEAWNVTDRELFNNFGSTIAGHLSPEVADPLVDSFWPLVLHLNEANGARAISLARQSIETQWGMGLVESPMSLWAETPTVQHLFCMILADLPRFHAIHDQRLKAYRAEHGIRSRNHPVADLQTNGDWWEAPLWAWRDSHPIREPLWARMHNDAQGVDLRMENESEPIASLAIRPDSSTDSGISELSRLAQSGIRIRPRALVTTALCRTLLADLFVHGIGGAIYDELGDSIFSQFFGFMPPAYAVTSATLRLADFPPATARREVEAQIRLKRRMQWKAETLAEVPPETQNLLQEKNFWLNQPTEDRKRRRERARRLREINRAIATHLASDISMVENRISSLRQEAATETLARSREYSIMVHSEGRLRKLANLIRSEL